MMALFIFAYLLSSISYAVEEKCLEILDTFRFIPQTSMATLKTSFSKESIGGWSAILASSAVLYYYDEKLYDDARDKGRKWKLGNDDDTGPLLRVSGYELMRFPTNFSSSLYFLGDGWTHFMIAGSVWSYGKATDQTYEVNTGVILMHGILVGGIFSQALKRSFGRESPNVKTHERGLWRFFPNFNDYNRKTASYDAMPSGHVMTSVLTFTILAQRYPEHQKMIYGIGGVWVSALSFEMMNNGVHWASDFPLAIGMGWVIGRAATQMALPAKNQREFEKTSWQFIPIPTSRGLVFSAFKSF